MFKVRRSLVEGRAIFALSGRIEEQHLAELENVLRNEANLAAITFDLEEVKLVDREAIGFLAGCEAQGIELKNCPPYVRKWIDTRSDIRDEQ